VKPLPLPPLGIRAAHLLALSAFAISEPRFEKFAKTPEYFAVRGYHASDVILYSLVLVIAVPAILIGIELVAGLVHRRAVSVVHQLFVCFLAFAVLGNTLFRHPSPLTLVLSVGLVVVFATAYRFWMPTRSFVTMAAFAPILFVAAFLYRSDLGAFSTSAPAGLRMPEVHARTPVVLVVFDEFALSSLMLDEGTIDSVRYPNFAALSRTSTWYRDATTVHDVTDHAVPSILTGRLGKSEQLPTVADHPRNLFTLLGRSHEIHSAMAEARLCPTNLCPDASPPFGTRLARMLSDVKTTSLGRQPHWTGDWNEPADEVEHFLRTIKPSQRPQLDVVHVLLPHVPYQYLPSGRAYDDGRALPGYGAAFRWSANPWFVTHNYERYLLQLSYTDSVLGDVVGRLRSSGLWERSLFIVTADHGVSFRPGGHRRYVDASNVGDIAPIPLFVKLPGQERGRVDRLEARSIDIVPTIADVLGARVPWKFDGRSLLAGARRPPSEVVVWSYTGDVVRATWNEVEAGQRRTLEWKARLFGSGTDSVFAEGSDRQLLGESIAAFPRWHTESIRADVRQPSSVSFDPRSSVAPSRVSGIVTGASRDQRLKLAIAVNGKVVAVTGIVTADEQSSFSTFVPDSAFRPGQNSITVLALGRDETGEVAFARVGSKGRRPSRSAAGH
jgi:hypothetical protein